MQRTKIPRETEFQVLMLCRRRCTFCFGLSHDAERKVGQIAHVDRDSKNNTLQNLAFLCFVHHDEYDSTTRQSKRLTDTELLRYLDALHDYVARMLALGPSDLARPAEWSAIQDEALEFFTATHRAQAIVRLLEEGPRSAEALNRHIPPHDLAFTHAVLEDALHKGWAERSEGGRFTLTDKARRMLAALDAIPESVLEDAWRDVWNPQGRG